MLGLQVEQLGSQLRGRELGVALPGKLAEELHFDRARLALESRQVLFGGERCAGRPPEEEIPPESEKNRFGRRDRRLRAPLRLDAEQPGDESRDRARRLDQQPGPCDRIERLGPGAPGRELLRQWASHQRHYHHYRHVEREYGDH